MKDGKNGSARSVSGGRAITSPTASARETERARARELGVQPSSSGDGEDPGPGLRGEPRAVVERERDGALGDARSAGDVVDRGPGHPID